MKYEFKCDTCNKAKELEVSQSEYYVPECCDKPMVRIFSAAVFNEGKLRN